MKKNSRPRKKKRSSMYRHVHRPRLTNSMAEIEYYAERELEDIPIKDVMDTISWLSGCSSRRKI